VKRRNHRARLLATAGILASLAGGCSDRERAERSSPPQHDALLPVALPDVSRLEASVQQQVRERYAALERLRQGSGAPAAEIGEGYGEVGTLLMATEFLEPAAPYLRNARTLAPEDRRWPYYLGHLYRSRGMPAQAMAFFEEALARSPNDVATLVWLGEMHLTEGRPDAAAPLFDKVLALQPQSLPGRFGRGRASLAQHNYRGAVEHLEAALALDANAMNVHYLLAMAYRGLGDAAKAEAHLRRQGRFEILPPDPLMEELRESLRSAMSYELRGTRALNGGRWANAIAEFRRGLEVDPGSPSLRHKLGTALHMQGDAEAARKTFEQVIQESPQYAKAHYSLGLLLESSGRAAEAMERFSRAVRLEPEYVEARVRLAELLRRQGRLREALTHYERVLEVNPRVPEAAFGSAMAFVRLNRYQEALDVLRAASNLHPNEPALAHAVARLLAAAPDASVRNGSQALATMQAMPDPERRLDMGETMAMALAEAGRFSQAATWQRDAIAAARRAGNDGLAQRMTASLRLYEAGRPCRTPWRDEDLP
jgi:tetratricopeptide (TPR) repeat protein